MLPNWLYGKSKSKLASILGGGIPEDYNQVKAQVTQNTEDIALLSDALEDSVTWDVLSEVGAVNYAPNNLVTQTVSQANFTLTHNADDSITVYSDGATSDWAIEVCSITLKAGTYRLKGTGTDDVKFQITDNPLTHALYAAGANDVIMTFATDTAIKLRVAVFNGKSYSNLVIYPMISDSSYNGPYVPYAKTNKELTEDITAIESVLPDKLSIIKDATWHHTVVVTCDLTSGGVAYLLTSSGILVLRTSSSSITMNKGLALEADTSSYFKSETSGLESTITVWGESTFETSKNAIWSLIPITGNWTMVLT